MKDALIVGILLVLLPGAVAVQICRAGRKGCCGSSDYRPKKKKLKRVSGSLVFAVRQMHCQHCADRVTEIINDIPGLSAKVDWQKGIATVFYEQSIPTEQLLIRLNRAGYPAEPMQKL